jgi:ATP phosphoribosyltransferase regulatory subunit
MNVCARSVHELSALMTDVHERIPLPDGMRDVLPVEAGELGALEHTLSSVFASYGYRQVQTPLLELSDVLDRAQDEGVGRAYRLFDDQGRVLVLRPDLTIPIARLIATRMAGEPGPLRVSYTARAVQPPSAGTGQGAERRQAGIELCGPGGAEDDAEVIAALSNALAAAGLPDARVAIGSVALVSAVLDAAGATADAADALWRAIRGRSMVAWRAEARAVKSAKGRLRTLLNELPTVRGGVEVLTRIAKVAPDAAPECARLARTVELVTAQGMPAPMIDLGVMRDWSYYSGVVIEAYAPGVAAPVAVGGRYDGLGARFGRPRSAVGVAVTLELLHHAVGGPEGIEPTGVVVVGGLDERVTAAAMLRATGVPVVAVPLKHRDAEALAAADGRRYVARPVKAGWRVIDVVSGATSTVVSLEEGPWT